MKNFHEHFKYRIDVSDGTVVLRKDEYEQIQLDAMKEGARRAAESLDVMVGEPVTTSERARKLCYNAILSTAEQWTLNDL